MQKIIPVLRPVLPKAQDLRPYFDAIDGSAMYTNFGPLLVQFEKQLVDMFFDGEKEGLVTTSSGTSAIELAIQALEIEPDGIVLVPSFTFPATMTAIFKNRLTPCFVDVDEQSWQLTPDSARSIVARRKVALVLPVATFGVPVDVRAWQEFSIDTGVPVVVDAAAALGAQEVSDDVTYCFSLHATKPFSSGEGGLVVSRSEELLEKIKSLTNFGLRDGKISMLGTNAKMSEFHAAVGLAHMTMWEEQKTARQKLLASYKERFAGLPCRFQKHNESWIPAVLSTLFNDRVNCPGLIEELAQRGVQTRRWYYPACHMHGDLSGQSLIGGQSHKEGGLEITENLSKQLVGLPFHLDLGEAELDTIIEEVRRSINAEDLS